MLSSAPGSTPGIRDQMYLFSQLTFTLNDRLERAAKYSHEILTKSPTD